LICFAFILYGIFIAQIYYYCTNYAEDRSYIKSYVALLCILESCHTAFCIHILYFYFIINYGNPSTGLERIVW